MGFIFMARELHTPGRVLGFLRGLGDRLSWKSLYLNHLDLDLRTPCISETK